MTRWKCCCTLCKLAEFCSSEEVIWRSGIMGCENPKGAKLDGGLYKFNMLAAELRGKVDCEGTNDVNADGDDETNRGGGDARKELP